jgi:arylsulfatase A-like enzyme
VVRKEWALHFDAIKMVDYDVKRILAELEEDGLLENTIIFFISDHGSEALRNKQFLYRRRNSCAIYCFVFWQRLTHKKRIGKKRFGEWG